MRAYRIKRTSIEQRKKWFKERDIKLRKMIRGRIDDSYLKSSRETAADIVAAHRTGRTFSDVGNMANQGQISNLPIGCVVETSIMVDKTGLTPVSFGGLPELALSFIEPWVKVYKMTVDACFQKDKNLAFEALRLDPVCSHLNGRQVKELGQEFLAAHKKFIHF